MFLGMKKTMRKIDETTLPHPSEKLTILKYTIDYLTSNGLRMIGMDHFAKPDDELFLAIERRVNSTETFKAIPLKVVQI